MHLEEGSIADRRETVYLKTAAIREILLCKVTSERRLLMTYRGEEKKASEADSTACLLGALKQEGRGVSQERYRLHG